MYEEHLAIDAAELTRVLTYCPSTYTIRCEIEENPEPMFLVINDYDQTISLVDDLDEFSYILNDTITNGKTEYILKVEECDTRLYRVYKVEHAAEEQ
jgi:hypothetical protein